jgi:hypothetical protein
VDEAPVDSISIELSLDGLMSAISGLETKLLDASDVTEAINVFLSIFPFGVGGELRDISICWVSHNMVDVSL